MIKIGVIGSTKGSDLPAIVECIRDGELKGLAEIVVVISNKKNSGILEKARTYGIENYFVNPKNKDCKKLERIQYDIKIDEILDKFYVELTVLIGYDKLFSGEFVSKRENKIMNIHPSLLPDFPGMDRDVHKRVLHSMRKVSGCTLHFVDKGKDTGPIILKKVVSVYENDDVDSLRARVQKEEQEIYHEGIRLYAEGKLKIEGRKVIILDKCY